jgi:hypothetical protein
MTRIYINSRGFEQNSDYCWVDVSQDSHSRVSNLPIPFDNDVKNLVYIESPSVLLSSTGDKLFLLLCSIEPEGRVDFTGRQIAMSVAWLVDETKENEMIFRMLAAQALDDNGWNTITSSIAQAVTLGGEYGFQGDFNLLNALLDFEKAKELVSNNPLTDYGQTTHRLAKLSPTMKSKLAKELLEFKLPKTSDSEDMVLVVVTKIKKEETLRNALVWRGLSNLVNREDWWTYYPLAKPVGDLLWFLITVSLKINRNLGLNFRAILERVLLNRDV